MTEQKASKSFIYVPVSRNDITYVISITNVGDNSPAGIYKVSISPYLFIR